MRAFMGLNLSPLITCSPQWSHRHVTLLGLPSTSVTHLAKCDFDGQGVLVIVFLDLFYVTPGVYIKDDGFRNLLQYDWSLLDGFDACLTFHPPGVPIFLFKKKFLLPWKIDSPTLRHGQYARCFCSVILHAPTYEIVMIRVSFLLDHCTWLINLSAP